MKVYIAWDGGDYYGPDMVDDVAVCATLELAQAELVKFVKTKTAIAWERDGNTWELTGTDYFITEYEVLGAETVD